MKVNPFASLGLSRQLVAWLATDSDRALEFITGYRNHFARLFSPDMTAEVLAKMNTALGELRSMSADRFVATARAFVQGGTDDELFGPKRELQEAEKQIKRLKQDLEAAVRQNEALKIEKSKEELQAYDGMTKILQALLVTDNLPVGAMTPAMLHGYTFFGNTKSDRIVKVLSPEETEKTGRKRLHYAQKIEQPILRVSGSGHLIHTLVETTFPQLTLFKDAMKQLNEEVDRVLAEPDSVLWENQGLFIGFSVTTTSQSTLSPLRDQQAMNIELLARLVTAPYFQIARDVLKRDGDAETNHFISIVRERGNVFRVNSYPIVTKGYRAPIAPS